MQFAPVKESLFKTIRNWSWAMKSICFQSSSTDYLRMIFFYFYFFLKTNNIMKIFFEWQGRKTKGAVAMHLVIQAPQWPASVFTCSGLHSKPRFLSLWLLAVFECTCIYCLSFSWPLYQKYHIKEAERGTEVGEERTQRSQQKKEGLSQDWGHCRCFFFKQSSDEEHSTHSYFLKS